MNIAVLKTIIYQKQECITVKFSDMMHRFFYLNIKVMWQCLQYLRLFIVATSWSARWFLRTCMMKSGWMNEKTLDKEEHKRCFKSYKFCKNNINNWNENHLMEISLFFKVISHLNYYRLYFFFINSLSKITTNRVCAPTKDI